jgi:outer membrane receptor protein involved in Fe transport
LDFYRTDFQNQIVVDRDQDAQAVYFYNLDGVSFANSIQIQGDYELFKRFDVRLAYRWHNVKTTYGGEELRVPLYSPHRAFVNLAYKTENNWKFDYTASWQSQQRVPSTAGNPEPFQVSDSSPSFFMMNAQVTKVWFDRLDVYVGVENLLNFTQEDPIISSANPFSNYFDSSLVWGPIFGRMMYVGLRYRIP